MNKQIFISTSTSISEAVREYVKGLDAEYQDHAADDFIAGSAWQKEQGIDWFSVDINPDVDWHETEDGGSFKISKPLLLWKEGVSPVTGRFLMQLDSQPFYRLESGNWIPTHYAYLTLPKTD